MRCNLTSRVTDHNEQSKSAHLKLSIWRQHTDTHRGSAEDGGERVVYKKLKSEKLDHD